MPRTRTPSSPSVPARSRARYSCACVGCPPTARSVARSVAVLGDAAQLPHVAALSGLSEPVAAAAVATLTRSEVLCDDDPIGFVHPVVAEAVYRDLPAAERGLEHERAAALLRSRGASAEQVAAHLLLAPCRGDAATVEVLRAAARKAAHRGGHRQRGHLPAPRSRRTARRRPAQLTC